MNQIGTNARQVDPPLLNGWPALEQALRNPELPIHRMAPLSLKPTSVSLETAVWLADRGRVDELYVTAKPDA